MSDYAVLITVGPTVLQYLVRSTATSPHARAALGGLKALRWFSTALFYVPTPFSDGEKAMKERPTVAELQVMGESLMIELRRLLTVNGIWERPSVNRVLELLYRTLPLAQLGSAICELIFEKFHQHSKREVSQSNSRNPAEYFMQRWRDTEHYSRASWLLGQESQPLKSVTFHSLGPHKRQSLSTNMRWRPRTAARTVLGSTEEFWRSRAPNAYLAFWLKPRKRIDSLSSEKGPQCLCMRMEPRPNTSPAPICWIAENCALSVCSPLEQSMASSMSPVRPGRY